MRRSSFRIWLAGTLLTAGSFSYGYLAHRNSWFPAALISRAYQATQAASRDPESVLHPRGFWQPVAATVTTTERERLTEQLGTLPYLAGYETAPPRSGVVRHDSTAAYRGLNYYTSGHATDVILMDMEGNRLHTWHYEPEDARGGGSGSPVHPSGYLRRALITPDGDVLAIYDPLGDERVQGNILVKLDRDSNVLWSYEGGIHHDFEVANDGRIYVLGRDYRSLSLQRREHPGGFLPHWPWDRLPDDKILEDFVIILSSDGEELHRVSILEAFVRSPYSAFAEQMGQLDILHTNTLEILSDRLQPSSRAFRPGNVLISALYPSAIGILDMESEQIVWALAGPWYRQHQPTVLENGRMLLFDNHGSHGFSKVIEFNPFTLEILWSYQGDDQNGFASPALGSAIRLRNGNTLITESTAGRAFEVTPDNRVVWEFINPEQAGKNGELIAVIPEMVRIDPDFDLTWLPRDDTAVP